MGTIKRYTLLSLLAEGQKIVIPMLQRDYAQGREGEKARRNKFLEALKRYLADGKKHELDFVYGSKHGNEITLFDGQQRLTTLFLLHWFLATVSDNEALRSKVYRA